MNLLPFAYLVGLGMMIVVPVLVIWLARRWTRLPWMLPVAGALAFIGSQLVHFPLLFLIGLTVKLAGGIPDGWKLVFDCAVGGLGAGLCEEWARWVVIAKWRKDARDARSALLLGLGHGGIEAIILGALVAVGFLNMLVLGLQDPAELGVPADQVETVRAQVDAYWRAPFYYPLLSGAERWMAMTLHVANNLLVMVAVVHRRTWLVWLAVLWHAVANATVLAVNATWGIEASETSLLALTPISVAIAVLCWRALRPAQAP